MKILHIVTRIDSGGISSFLYNYYSHLNRSQIKFDVVAISTGVKQGCHESFENIGMGIYYMPEKLLARLSYLIRMIKKGKYDVVHAHIELQSSIYLFIAALCGVKIRVSHAHLSRANPGIKNKALQFLLNRIATKRMGASDLSISAVFGKRYAKKGIVVNNAIDVDKFEFNPAIREKYRVELGLSDKLTVGFVGRLSYQKNISFLVKVFAALVEQHPDSVLLVVGDGELRQQMNSELAELGLLTKVIFLATRNDVNALMMAMDVMLLPSFSEGLPLVLVEAQAVALKCVVSNKVTKLIAISDYIVYLGIEDFDINSWVETILIQGIGSKRISMRNIISEKGFNIDCEASQLIALYEDKD
jgi:glycosyltransferase involved in cell wall biosynthesis